MFNVVYVEGFTYFQKLRNHPKSLSKSKQTIQFFLKCWINSFQFLHMERMQDNFIYLTNACWEFLKVYGNFAQYDSFWSAFEQLSSLCSVCYEWDDISQKILMSSDLKNLVVQSLYFVTTDDFRKQHLDSFQYNKDIAILKKTVEKTFLKDPGYPPTPSVLCVHCKCPSQTTLKDHTTNNPFITCISCSEKMRDVCFICTETIAKFCRTRCHECHHWICKKCSHVLGGCGCGDVCSSHNCGRYHFCWGC